MKPIASVLPAVSVLFVCTGNICRSPTADGVFRSLVAREGLANKIAVDSAGTGSWHVGDPPDLRAQKVARQRGYDLSFLRARQVSEGDFTRHTHILGLDQGHVSTLVRMAPVSSTAQIRLFLEDDEVPDPYYGSSADFEHVLDLVEEGCSALLDQLLRQTDLGKELSP